MLTKNDIFDFLRDSGIASTDTVLVHTSMRALGKVEGGCDGLIDAFKEYLSDGLFMVPTHTWANVGADNPVYDVKKTVPCIGALPTVAAFREDGVRSLHPTHSMTAFGKRAKEYVLGEEKATSPCPGGGAWARLYDEKAKILLLGVKLNRNTFIHAVDEMLELPDRLADPIELTVIGHEGECYTLNYRKHAQFTGSAFFENYRAPLERLGALGNARLGNAEVGIFDAERGTKVIKALWAHADYNFCADEKEIPEEYYRDLL